jgi:hypothetical protein
MTKPSKERPTRFKYNEGRVRSSTKILYTGWMIHSPIWATRFKYNEGRALYPKQKIGVGNINTPVWLTRNLLVSLQPNSGYVTRHAVGSTR